MIIIYKQVTTYIKNKKNLIRRLHFSHTWKHFNYNLCILDLNLFTREKILHVFISNIYNHCFLSSSKTRTASLIYMVMTRVRICMHMYTCFETMYCYGGKKCGLFVQQGIHRKTILVHIKTYFRNNCIFKKCCTF